MPKQLSVNKMGWAAARLWAAFMTQQEGETYHDIVKRSGIQKYETFVNAREQLFELGLLVMCEGKECPTLYAQEQLERQTEPVTMWPGTVSRVTNAKQ